jgi:2-polyprenyl-3-methyl-5-hydroxy-6-metoxy-1,4-benzoquinol methylase
MWPKAKGKNLENKESGGLTSRPRCAPLFPAISRAGAVMNSMRNDEEQFRETVERIRAAAQESLTGQWFNLIRAGGCDFIQGQVYDTEKGKGCARNIALLVEGIRPEDIDGFWPEVTGHPVTETEEDFLVRYISSLDENEVELIVPLRNVSPSVNWGRFDEEKEYEIYASAIYPALLDALSGIRFERILDAGCGSGNLLVRIAERYPDAECHGIDMNPENVEAATEKGLNHIYEGDAEEMDRLLPGEATFDVIIFCGLLNRQVLEREKAWNILMQGVKRLSPQGHVIITGYSSCHLTADDLSRGGLAVIRKSLPHNLFKDYDTYALRQLYLCRKNT